MRSCTHSFVRRLIVVVFTNRSCDVVVNRGKLPEDELGVMPDVAVDTLDGLVSILDNLITRIDLRREV